MITRTEFHADKFELVEAFQEDYGRSSRVPLERKPYRYSLRTHLDEEVAVFHGEQSCAEVIRASVTAPSVLLHLPQGRVDLYQIGRRSLSASAESAVLLPPNHDYTLHSTGGLKYGLAVRVDLVLANLEERGCRRRGHALIKPCEIRLTLQARGNLSSLNQRFLSLAEAAPGPDTDRAVRVLNAEFAAWLADRILENDGCQSLSPRNRMRMEQIIDWIDRHLGEAISVEQLISISGLGAGGLNKICKVSRGLAPMELVQSRRLIAAHRMLRNSQTESRVTTIAQDCGFKHAGRFANGYRQTFGESPSDTLRRARGQA